MAVQIPHQQDPPRRETCPHEDEITRLVDIAEKIDAKFGRVEEALIGSIENPGGGVLVRLSAVENTAEKLDAKVAGIDDRVDAVEGAAEDWKGLKRWGIGLVIAAVAGSGGAAKLVSIMNQQPTPASTPAGGTP